MSPRSAAALLYLWCWAVAGCTPPWAEALVVVDTDLPAPAIAGRLRVDLYSETGVWFESRDIARPAPTDWPVSFSVYSDDETREQRALLRLRAYPGGRVRDYHGEHFVERPNYQEPRFAHSIEELCAAPPELKLDHTLTVRRGDRPFESGFAAGGCTGVDQVVGSAAALLEIPEDGRYVVGVVDGGAGLPRPQVSLQIRSVCGREPSATACDDGYHKVDGQPAPTSLGFAAAAGDRLYVITGGTRDGDGAADVTLAATRERDWSAFVAPSNRPAPLSDIRPRLIRDGVDVTPLEEPAPESAVDRLVLLRLTPGGRGRLQVTLSGACARTPARLLPAVGRQDAVALESAEGCVDTDGVRVAPVVAELEPDLETALAVPRQSQVGTFVPRDDCPTRSNDAPVVCVPSGVFLFGSSRLGETDELASRPERIARMSSFWMDRNEVTVGRWYHALQNGFHLSALDARNGSPQPNNLSLSDDGAAENNPIRQCTWSSKRPIERTDYGMSCVSWDSARALCHFLGGELPTEAQWEYAAVAAGRTAKSIFPWGDDAPDCDRAVWGRWKSPSPFSHSACYHGGAPRHPDEPPSLPLPVTARASPGEDVNVLGVIGMGGGLAEWTLDSAQPLSADCWRSTALGDPACLESEPPAHSVRGGTWSLGISQLDSSVRQLATGHAINPTVGFRCVYPSRPAWSQP